MATEDDIRKVAETVIADEFGEGAKLLSVSIKEDRDPAGNEILLVRVVYDPVKERLDAKVVAGMIRHLRSKLYDDIEEERFPLISFVTKVDAQAEAA